MRTQRLVLRRWRVEDLAPFADLNADPDVMAHMQKTMSRQESDAFVARIEEEFDDCGFGFWAVEVPSHSPFIGFVGLHRVPFDAPFTPAVEVGWRLAREHWGYGFVTEAARSAVRYGLEEVGLDEIVSFTNPDNVRSWKVMERLGMIRDPASDFEHPNVPAGHWLRPHIFYRFPEGRPRRRRAITAASSGGQRNTSSSACDGDFHPRVCRGLSLSSAATSSRSAWVKYAISVRFGKY